MEKPVQLHRIACLYSDFKEKFGIPRQSGLTDAPAKIVFEPEYRVEDAFRGLEEYSHLWLLWQFSKTSAKEGRHSWSPTVRPPRLGGNTRVGVFATRSPFRPNPIGLSCVRLESIELHTADGPVLHIAGADLLDGTPILDIKPYLPYVDSHPEALGGFAERVKAYSLKVDFPEIWRSHVTEEEYSILSQLLCQDPRPSYHRNPDRVYGMSYGSLDIRFTVAEDTLHVCGLCRRE